MIHTIQLVSPTMSFANYRCIEDRVYQNVRGGICKIINRQESFLFFCLPQYPGLLIRLIGLAVPHIVIVVNPARILGGGYHDLCSLTPELLDKCMEPIAHILREFKTGFTVDEMMLSRIDCTLDIRFPQGNALEAFIACVQQTNPPRGYHIERFSKRYPNYKEINRHSFRMACNNVCLTIYDKAFQLMNEGLIEENEILPDRLRFEVAFHNPAFQRLFVKYQGGILIDDSNKHDAQKLIIGFSNLSLRLLQAYFGQHMTPGQYLNKDLAFLRIDSSHFSAKVKSKMKALLTEVARCHKGGIKAALDNLEWNGLRRSELNYLMKCFEKINLNPATIKGSAGFQEFPSVTELLDNEECFIKPFFGCSNSVSEI